MLDLALFVTVMGMFVAGLRRPFLWVLAYAYIDILAPQKIGWTLTPLLPISLIAFLLAFGGWALFDRKDRLAFSVRQALLALLLGWCFMTLQWAAFPDNAADKWEWVWKALVFAIFLPFTLTTRLRLEALVLVMVLTAGAIIIQAGMKTALGGGGYASLYLFVNDNSNIYESSTLATAAIGIIPLILWLRRHGTIFPRDWRVTLFAGLLILACLLVPIGTEARTGLLCIGVLGVMMLREVKNRFAYLAAAAALGLVAVPFLPQSYLDRMATLGAANEDQSASTRVAVWEWTVDYAAEHPLGGGFDSYRANRFEYRMPVQTRYSDNTVSIEMRDVVDEARAFHSAVFEMLGEQGYVGLGIWLLLHALGVIQMELIRRRWKHRTASHEQWQAPLATALQYAQILYLVGALFQGIAYQPYFLMILALQIALWTYVKRLDAPRRATAGEALSAGSRPAPIPSA